MKTINSVQPDSCIEIVKGCGGYFAIDHTYQRSVAWSEDENELRQRFDHKMEPERGPEE